MVGWMDTPGETATQQKFHGAGDDWLSKAESKQRMGQLVKPDQVAGLVSYLLSPESGVMTGALVDYDQNVAGAYTEGCWRIAVGGWHCAGGRVGLAVATPVPVLDR